MSEAAITTVQAARAPSTRALYESKWRVFSRWCVMSNLSPSECGIEAILNFLQHRLDTERAAPSTIKVYAAAISSFHREIDGSSVFSHPLMSSFIKGVARLHPVRRPIAPPWDLGLVLDALCGPPFEPIEVADIKWLSAKTALLLALTSGKRVSDITALSTQRDCCVIAGDGSRATLRPNPAFVPKVLKSAFSARPISLSAFHPPPHGSGVEARLHRLCPVRALARYIQATAPFRRTQQLLVCYSAAKRGLPLSSQRLSHWLTEAIRQAYTSAGREQPQSVRAHSTRGVAASAALFAGVSVEDICSAACWSSSSPFVRFYLVDMADSTSFSASVLSQAASARP